MKKIGVAKRDNLIDLSLLEFCLREELNKTATRIMAVLDPIKLIISNYPENKTEELTTENLPGWYHQSEDWLHLHIFWQAQN